jgi:hypothetical protein
MAKRRTPRVNQERLLEILEHLPWAGIDEIKDAADAANIWPEGFNEAALEWAKKVLLRNEIKRLVDPSGFPLVASVVNTTAEGEEERQYKLELYMTEPDYRQVVA